MIVRRPRNLRYEWDKAKEKAVTTVAWWLPRQVAYWACIRVMAHATVVHGDREVPSLSIDEVLKAWRVRP